MLAKRLDELKLTGNLPSPTGVGLAILEQTSRDDYSLGELAKTLQTDPALTGRILKLANSSAKAGAVPVATVADATMRLGVRTVRSIALGFSLVSGNRAGRCAAFDYEAYWSRALACAAAAQMLAERLKTAVPAEAFTCGLLAEIGKLALASIHPEIYSRLLEQGKQVDPDEFTVLEARELGVDHRELAAAMLADWKLPESFGFAVASWERPEGDPVPPNDQARHMAAILREAVRIAEACLLHDDGAPEACRAAWMNLADARRLVGLDEEPFVHFCDQIRSSWRDWGAILKIATHGGPSFEEIARIAAERTRVVVSEPTAENPARKGLRILAVDDDAVSLKMLVHSLTRDGHMVMTARNGKEALGLALQHNPQMVVTDWVMPELDGIDVCKALRRSSEGVATYILLLTGREEEDRVVEAFDAGADEYVCKPFNARVLLARVRAGQRMIELREQVERDKQDRARQVAEMAVLNRRLQAAALTDVLTELHNRRYAMKRLEQELENARRSGSALAVIMIDLDKFKSINDEHGHDVGDAVLRETADVLRLTTRRGDVVTRLGGEEFLVICPGSDVSRATLLAERIRSAVEQHMLRHGSFQGYVTVSAGVAALENHDQTLDSLLKVADRRVYAAKAAGRNRVSSDDETWREAQAG